MGDYGGGELLFDSLGGTGATCGVSFALGSIITLVRISVGMGLSSLMEGTLGCSEAGAAMLLHAGGGGSAGLTLEESVVVDELSRRRVDKRRGGGTQERVVSIMCNTKWTTDLSSRQSISILLLFRS